MNITLEMLLDALNGKLTGRALIELITELRALPPESILSVAVQGGISITGDGNIIGNNNISIEVTGERATELAYILRNAFERGQALHQLRAPVADFVGRGVEIERLICALSKGGRASIGGISGMGGVGKSELALLVANRLRDDYPDAQLFVNLRGLDKSPLPPADALSVCIRAFAGLDAKLPDDVNELRSFYLSALKDKRALILLDNATDDKQVRPLLPPTGCALLVTSRMTISLPGMERIALDQLKLTEARDLLIRITPHVAQDIADRICHLCGYLPLAIRAAGSLLEVFTDLDPVQYANQLFDERTRLERIGIEGVDIGVEASFNLSYTRLKPETAQVFRCLALFRVDFDALAEEIICDDVDHRHLSALVRLSLAFYEKERGRYRLHDLVRIFADSWMSEAERGTGERRHAAHYGRVLAQAETLYFQGGGRIMQGLELFDRERMNIEAGHEWAVDRSETDEFAAKLCIAYPEAGVHIIDLRQHPHERIKWLEVMRETARRLQQRDAESRALGNLGTAYFSLGEIRRAIEFHEQQLEIARETGDRNSECIAFGNLGIAYAALGETHRAIDFYEHVLEIARETHDRRGEGQALGNLGTAYFSLGETHRAIGFFERNLAIAREVGDRRAEGLALGNLGNSYIALGEPRRAIGFFEQDLAIARETGDRRGEGAALGNLGNAYNDLGEPRRAIEVLEQRLVIARETGDRRGAGAALGNLGIAYKNLRETRRAIEFFERSLAIARETGDRRGEATALGNLGNAYRNLGDIDRTIEFQEQVLVITREIGDRRTEGMVLGNIGATYSALGEMRRAIKFFEQTLEIARETGDRKSEGRALWNTALALDLLAERTRAITCAESALLIWEQIESPYAEMVREALVEWKASDVSQA
jgi:tetratricopeptide (TPR) repeat protein